jgi:predicted enzyme related to lactoylglutathione lyase
VRTYPHGVPCWVDCEQPEIDAARRFYGGLFGWSFEDAMPPEAPAPYLIASLEGHVVAALAPAGGDAAPAWNTYVAVDDADASAAAVAAAGGTVILGPLDAGPGRRLAGCRDPRGATFRLWQAQGRVGAELVNAPGTWNFSDLQTSDAPAAEAFYAPLFGWVFEDLGIATLVRRPGYGDHLEATVDPGIRDRQAGVVAPPGFEDAVAWVAPSAAGAADRWHVSFTVEDRDDSAARAEDLGATVVVSEDTDWTRTALVRDPQGAELTLSQFTPPEGGG